MDEYFSLGADEDADPSRMSPWVLRIVLSKEMVLDKNLTLMKVAEKINLHYEDFLYCIFTDDNADELVLRVRMKIHIMNQCNLYLSSNIDVLTQVRILADDMEKGESGSSDYTDYSEALRKLEAMVMELDLQGVANINKVFIREEKTEVWDEEGSTGFMQGA